MKTNKAVSLSTLGRAALRARACTALIVAAVFVIALSLSVRLVVLSVAGGEKLGGASARGRPPFEAAVAGLVGEDGQRAADDEPRGNGPK